MSYGHPPGGYGYYRASYRNTKPHLYMAANTSRVTTKHPGQADMVSNAGWPSPEDSTDNSNANDKTKNNARGSALVAKMIIPTDEIVCSIERMAVSALDTPRLKDTCYHCFSTSHDVASTAIDSNKRGNSDETDVIDVESAIKPRLKVCTGCRVVKFCDKACQSSAWENHHKFECRIYAELFPRVLPNNVRAIVRLLLQKKNSHLPAGLWDDILKLESHITELRKAGGVTWENLVIMAQGAKEYSKTDQDFNIVLELFCILMINSLTWTTGWCDPMGLCLHPLLARMNHSCEPNAYVQFPFNNPQEEITVLPLRKIKKNQEITIAYVDPTESVERRQKQLQERYFFTCECSKCSSEKVDVGYPRLQNLDLSAAERRALELLESAVKNTSITQQIEKLRYGLFVLEDSKMWPVERDPYPRLMHKLILAYIDHRQYNKALAYASVQQFDIDPKIFANESHPVRVTHTMLLARLMNLVINAEDWASQDLDLRQFGLNLVWLRIDLLRGMQRALAKTGNREMSNLVSRELLLAARREGVSASTSPDADRTADREKAMLGLRKLIDWAYSRIRKWETA